MQRVLFVMESLIDMIDHRSCRWIFFLIGLSSQTSERIQRLVLAEKIRSEWRRLSHRKILLLVATGTNFLDAVKSSWRCLRWDWLWRFCLSDIRHDVCFFPLSFRGHRQQRCGVNWRRFLSVVNLTYLSMATQNKRSRKNHPCSNSSALMMKRWKQLVMFQRTLLHRTSNWTIERTVWLKWRRSSVRVVFCFIVCTRSLLTRTKPYVAINRARMSRIMNRWSVFYQ